MHDIGIALLGSRFMGKAHSHAWRSVDSFFDPPLRARLEVIGGRDRANLEDMQRRFGWARTSTDWEEMVTDPAVGLVDVATPNHLHAEQSIAALEAGKAVACEKPLAATLGQAAAMAEAARGRATFVWFTYRRVPALGLARRLVMDGLVGRLFHVRAAYLQGWGGPSTPLLWRFREEEAGSGAHGDLNAHIIDMARFVTGDEFSEIAGAIEQRFVDRRTTEDGTLAPSTVDDAVLFLARFRSGAVGSFEATRLATGVKNSNRIEIHGERGALRFDFERMNELQIFEGGGPAAEAGWKTILATHPDHPWAGAWWPDGHWLGYEHTFTNTAADILAVLGGAEPQAPLADFDDAYQTQRVMEAAIISARQRRPVALEEVS